LYVYIVKPIDALSSGSDIQFPLKRTNNYEPPNHLEEIDR
jgi:hypothetical protein